jgi:hypothetical protein
LQQDATIRPANLLPRSSGKKLRHPRRSISKNLRSYPVIAIPAVDSNGMRSEIDTYNSRDTECKIFAIIREPVLKQAHL